ncbi:alpha/beta fold hydrolase [Deinococcus sp. SL84]|uniref:alpha/beta fold hydrolase n=1 Tax=Deinococcus sp. SL84 TaxID=2994663 RepID=UPI0022729C29|nr:alpha/beta hydrolase [Deinococcus sp. SL84]MCY1703254.1 alpha/beta hydrolase [Deinococcus sp. SL84]
MRLKVPGGEVAVRRLRHVPGSLADTRAPLVFLHDSLGCTATWRDFPQALAGASGRHALLYDRLGYGGSDPFSRPRTRDYLTHEAQAVLPAVLDAAGMERAVLFGHSDGASIALLAAALCPEQVVGAVAEAGHIFNEDVTRRGVEAAAHAYHTTDIAERLVKYHGDKVPALYRAWTDTWLAEDYRDWTVEPLLSGVVAPLLLIQGRMDEYGSLEQLWRTAAAAQGPVTVQVLARCGHTPHREAREAVLKAATHFLTGLD